MIKKTGAVLAVALTLGLGFAVSAAADTAPTTHNGIVGANPADFTPHVQDGDVRAIVQIGDRVIVGGNFTTVRLPGGTDVPRTNVFAFDATTGALDDGFVPAVDGQVSALQPAADGESVYLGGSFNNIDGVRSKSLARLRLSDGDPVSGFTVPPLNGVIKDLKLASGRLYIGGTFTRAANPEPNRTGLADLDPDTGAVGDFLAVQLTGTHQAGDTNTGVWKLDVAPDGERMVLIGNFDAASGQKREQFAVIDLSGETAALADYYTPRYEPDCSSSFDTYMRDVAFAPSGSYFVVVTTGAYRADTLCDAAARFETSASGTNVQPSWVNYTGGDTLSAVAISGPVVYIGGHQRWMNNAFCADRACQGAMDRAGIAALDPSNGMPFSWNPGKSRGVAVFDLTVTEDGLWVGSDTDMIAGETHRKIAFMPLSGGGPLPARVVGELPGEVYTAGGTGTSPADHLRVRTYDGTAAGPVTELPTGGLDWRTVRGAFMLGHTLYHGSADGELYRRDFEGDTPGTPVKIDEADLLARMTTWHGHVPSVRGMFFADGRIFYTRGTSALHYRYFNPESDAVGAQEWTAASDLPGLAWSSVGGMFAHGDKLYTVNETDGRLFRTDFVDGRPVSGTTVLADSGDWRGRAVFLDARPDVVDRIAYRAGAEYNANTLRATVTVPAEVRAGDGMLLFATVNNASHTIVPPAGWTEVGSATTGGAVSKVWQRTAAADDPGAEVAVGVSSFAKVDLRLAAYAGTAGTPVVRSASFVDPAVTTTHTTPEVAVADGGRWAVSYWADKSSTTTAWTPPTGVTVRGTTIGTGSGRVSAMLADSGRAVSTGTYGGLSATTDAASRGLMWTVLLGSA